VAPSAREQLEAFFARHFPGVKHPSHYAILAAPAPVSLDLWEAVEESSSDPRFGPAIGAVAARAYERVFTRDAQGFLYATKLALHGVGIAPEEPAPTIAPGERVNLAAFNVALYEDNVDLADLAHLCAMLPDDAVRRAELRHGLNLRGSYREMYAKLLRDDEPDRDVPYAELVVPVHPRDIDYAALFAAIADKDFPVWDRPRIGWDVLIIDADDPVIFDMPDDHYCGAGAPTTDRVRDLYVAEAAMLNDYRRADMEAVFGFWPAPAR